MDKTRQENALSHFAHLRRNRRELEGHGHDACAEAESGGACRDRSVSGRRCISACGDDHRQHESRCQLWTAPGLYTFRQDFSEEWRSGTEVFLQGAAGDGEKPEVDASERGAAGAGMEIRENTVGNPGGAYV